MRLLANGSSTSHPEAVNPIQEVSAFYIVMTSLSAPLRSFDYNLHIFHITMLLLHPLSETALSAALHMPSACFLILLTKSSSFTCVRSFSPSWIITRSCRAGYGRQNGSVHVRFQDSESHPSSQACYDHRWRSRHHNYPFQTSERCACSFSLRRSCIRYLKANPDSETITLVFFLSLSSKFNCVHRKLTTCYSPHLGCLLVLIGSWYLSGLLCRTVVVAF